MKGKCSAQLLIDADWIPGEGWEVSLRFGPDSMDGAWCNLTDDDLRSRIGKDAAELLIWDRDRTE